MKKILTCTIALILAICAFGQTRADSVKVYFHIGRSNFDPTLEDNASAMNHFIEKVREAASSKNLDHIVIRAYASPDGTVRFNNRLSQKRCATITDLILEKTGVNPDIIESFSEGIAWAELRDLVEADTLVPSREKILDILDNTPFYVFDSKGNIVSGRKKQLMDLRGGRPWKWMVANIFPELRNSVAVSIYLTDDATAEEPTTNEDAVADEANATPGSLLGDVISLTSDTLVFSDGSDISVISENLSDNSGDSEVGTGNSDAHSDASGVNIDMNGVSAQGDTGTLLGSKEPPYYLFALKTNMLYYPLLLPNLELEWLINDHWSVAVEGNVAWWGSYKKEKSYRLAIIDAEARRWFKVRSPWHGLYAGAIVGGGWYDLDKGPGHKGYYGEGAMAGLAVGYMWPLGRHFSLDAEFGAGYVYTRVKEYLPINGHHVYMKSKKINYFGPIKLKFSIAYRFFDRKKFSHPVSAQ